MTGQNGQIHETLEKAAGKIYKARCILGNAPYEGRVPRNAIGPIFEAQALINVAIVAMLFRMDDQERGGPT